MMKRPFSPPPNQTLHQDLTEDAGFVCKQEDVQRIQKNIKNLVTSRIIKRKNPRRRMLSANSRMDNMKQIPQTQRKPFEGLKFSDGSSTNSGSFKLALVKTTKKVPGISSGKSGSSDHNTQDRKLQRGDLKVRVPKVPYRALSPNCESVRKDLMTEKKTRTNVISPLNRLKPLLGSFELRKDSHGQNLRKQRKENLSNLISEDEITEIRSKIWKNIHLKESQYDDSI